MAQKLLRPLCAVIFCNVLHFFHGTGINPVQDCPAQRPAAFIYRHHIRTERACADPLDLLFCNTGFSDQLPGNLTEIPPPDSLRIMFKISRFWIFQSVRRGCGLYDPAFFIDQNPFALVGSYINSHKIFFSHPTFPPLFIHQYFY